MNEIESLIERAEDDATDASELRGVLDELLSRSSSIGSAVALGLLAREPRIKPSRGLLIDPSDEAYRRWQRRVVAAAALLASPSAATVRHELGEELAADPDLETDAWAIVTGATGVT